MKNQIRKRSEGFTIIEVLIVLAIAGLIMLIVFLAVPALQRNSRNTQRTSDVSRALGASQEVLNNNNGNMASLTSARLQTAFGDPAYYTVTNITVAAAPGSPTNNTTVDTVVVYTGGRCQAGGTGLAEAGTTRQLAVVFRVEPNAPRCQNS